MTFLGKLLGLFLDERGWGGGVSGIPMSLISIFLSHITFFFIRF